MKRAQIILIVICLCQFSLFSQKPPVNEILYGASYYHEYMPYERLEKDMQMMKDCGFNVIRIGESTWASFEPEEGRFEFAWFDRILDAAHRYNIKVIVGTPTYAIPQWMAKKHPDILVYNFRSQSQYGGRQNMDITNPDYLRYSERIIRKLVSHVANHPAVIGFQVDNETKSYGTAGENVRAQFLKYLQNKFITPDSLNNAWTLNYWSHNIAKWEDFNVTGGWANNAYWLDWNRFQRKLSCDFMGWQAKIIRELRKPNQFITQNFDLYWRNGESTGPQPEVDHWSSSKHMDIAGIDIYHKVQDQQDGAVIAFAGDYTRSFKMDNYLVLETQGQAKGSSTTQQVPYDGQLRQNVYGHLASGANMVSYWPWHSIHNSNETYWKGILSHDLEPNRLYYEVQKTARELKNVGTSLVNLKKKNKVAILYSQDAFNALFFKPFSKTVNYADVINQLHSALYKLNIEVDFIIPDKPRLSDYKAIIIPPLYVASDSLLNAISSYVKNGGTAVICFKSGFCNMNSAVRPIVMPGLLREACGISYQEFSNIDKLPLKENIFNLDEKDNYATEWVELIKTEKAKTILSYKHPFYGQYAAVTDNIYGKGRVIYQGTFLSDSVQEKILQKIFKETGLIDNESLAFPIIIRSGTNQSGKTIHYMFNYSAQNKMLSCPYNKGKELLSGNDVTKGKSLTIEPWGVLIIEEK